MSRWEEELSGEVTFWLGEDAFEGFVRWCHNCKNSEGKAYRTNGALPIEEGHGHPAWELVSKDPLTISPSILCVPPHGCGIHGFITDGKWVPA